MSPGGIIPIIFVFVIGCLQGSAGQNNACTPTNRAADLQACLSAIRQLATDSAAFWFGSSYFTRCPPALRFTVDCFNPYTTSKTLSELTFGAPNVNLLGLDRYIDIKYTSGPGSYTGCDYQYTQTHTEQFTIDPLSNATYTPWQLRTKPEITWTAAPSDLFTLIVIDVGYGFLHGLYVNIPGNDLNSGNEVDAYHGAFNGRDVPNPYAFVLYKQTARVDASSITLPVGVSFNITQFVDNHQVGNLVGLSWFLASYDAYSAQRQATWGFLQNCASLVDTALTNGSHPERPFLPDIVDLSVYLRIRVMSDALIFPCGPDVNENRCQPAADFYVDPIGGPIIKTAAARTGSNLTYTMQMNKLFPNNSVDFTGKMYSLVMVDPDIPPVATHVGTNELPLLHQMIINIQGADATTGTTLQSYLGPGPPDNKTHYYYFLLYKQKQTLQLTNSLQYTDDGGHGCATRLAGRCRFDVKGFASSNNLTLVGATWFKAETDEFILCRGLSQGRTILPSATCPQEDDISPTVSHAAFPMAAYATICIIALSLLALIKW